MIFRIFGLTKGRKVMIEQTFNVVKSKEVKNIRAYIHSKNEDGTLNLCFNLNIINPQPHHSHRYTRDYLEMYYEADGTVKWRMD